MPAVPSQSWRMATSLQDFVQATYPMQLVKTRLMSASKDTQAHMKYSGPVDAVLRIVKDEGAARFRWSLNVHRSSVAMPAACYVYIVDTLSRIIFCSRSPAEAENITMLYCMQASQVFMTV